MLNGFTHLSIEQSSTNGLFAIVQSPVPTSLQRQPLYEAQRIRILQHSKRDEAVKISLTRHLGLKNLWCLLITSTIYATLYAFSDLLDEVKIQYFYFRHSTAKAKSSQPTPEKPLITNIILIFATVDFFSFFFSWVGKSKPK